MTATPLVSVVIAARDAARYLPEALASVAAQDWPAAEVLIVEDGSTDATPALAEAFAAAHPRARVLRSAGAGPAAARALALQHAAGEFVAVHDADDRSAPGRLRAQAEFLAAHPEVVLVGSHADVIDASGAVIGAETPPADDAALRARLRRAPPFVHGSVMFRLAAARAAGGYRAAFRVAEDYDLYLRLADAGRFACLPERLYAWRRHGSNTFATRRAEHLFYAAAARAFAWERAAFGADSAAALERAAGPEAFLAAWPHGAHLARYWGEALVREGRCAEARRTLARAFADPAVALPALVWWAASWPVALTPRAARARTAGGAA